MQPMPGHNVDGGEEIDEQFRFGGGPGISGSGIWMSGSMHGCSCDWVVAFWVTGVSG